MVLFRHALAVAILPFTVTVLMPTWIARQYGVVADVGDSAVEIACQIVGLCVLGLGLVLFGSSLWRFATDGRGTLAPWDPPRVLVVRGPYRFVRNPMISGVVFVLIAEALLLLSPSHAIWAVGFLVLNLTYVPIVEEPQLARRFGGAYREYCRHVPRFIPRVHPWQLGPRER